MPPPFGGGEDVSLLFPSPPLEGKALYGISTWSFGSDSSGGGVPGGGSQQAAWKPPARLSSPTKKQVCNNCRSISTQQQSVLVPCYLPGIHVRYAGVMDQQDVSWTKACQSKLRAMTRQQAMTRASCIESCLPSFSVNKTRPSCAPPNSRWRFGRPNVLKAGLKSLACSSHVLMLLFCLLFLLLTPCF